MTLEEFIAGQIKTMDELHVLLLFQANPQANWDAEELARRFNIPTAAAAAAAASLVGNGLLTATGPSRYRWQTPSAEMAVLIDQLVSLDRERPVTLIRMIYHSGGSSRAFADAFKIKKEKSKHCGGDCG